MAPVLAIKFDALFKPRKSQTFERFWSFSLVMQREGESCESFLELQSLIATCEYDTQRDCILHDQIISVADIKTREKLLFDPQLTL